MSTFAWPDDGTTVSSVRDGISIALVFAAVPVATLAPTVTASSLVVLGGGMALAGFATTPGGNLLGSIMAVIGLLILLSRVSTKPTLTPGIIAAMLGCAFALSIGMYAVLGTTSWWQTLIAVVLAGAIAVGTRLGPTRKPAENLPNRRQGG